MGIDNVLVYGSGCGDQGRVSRGRLERSNGLGRGGGRGWLVVHSLLQSRLLLEQPLLLFQQLLLLCQRALLLFLFPATSATFGLQRLLQTKKLLLLLFQFLLLVYPVEEILLLLLWIVVQRNEDVVVLAEEGAKFPRPD